MRLNAWKMKPIWRFRTRARSARECVPPVRGRIEQAQDREQRGLSGARRPGYGDVFAFTDRQIDIGQRVSFHLVGVVHLPDALEINQCFIGLCHQILRSLTI
jgi:hypothetical protein